MKAFKWRIYLYEKEYMAYVEPDAQSILRIVVDEGESDMVAEVAAHRVAAGRF